MPDIGTRGPGLESAIQVKLKQALKVLYAIHFERNIKHRMKLSLVLIHLVLSHVGLCPNKHPALLSGLLLALVLHQILCDEILCVRNFVLHPRKEGINSECREI